MKKVFLTFFFLCSFFYLSFDAQAMTGSGTTSNPYLLSSCTDLQNIKQSLSSHYKLIREINCESSSSWNGGLGFEPIGNATTPFTGTFDGDGYTIHKLFINRPAQDYIGLFGYADGTQERLKNVSFKEASITGNQYVGVFSGYLRGSSTSGNLLVNSVKIKTSSVQGNAGFVGGLSGYTFYTTMSNSSFSGNVSGKGSYVGGLIGRSNSYSAFSTVYSAGETRNTSTYTGGLIGYSGAARIDFSYSTSQVYGNGYTGGLIGFSIGHVEQSYATGNVSTSGPGNNYVGGFIGNADSGSAVFDSYATGAVQGGDYVGGFIGRMMNDARFYRSYSLGLVTYASASTNYGGLVGFKDSLAVVANSYWNTQTSGLSTSKAGTGKTTSEMKVQSMYTNYDFSAIWLMQGTFNNGYPYLRIHLTTSASSTKEASLATLGLRSGPFSIDYTGNSVASFSNINMNNQIQSTHASLSSIEITDHRGTLEGWSLTLQASPFTETAASGGTTSGKSLPANSLVYNGVSSTSSPVSAVSSTSSVIDNGSPVSISLANAGTGGGTMVITHQSPALTLTVDTSLPYVNNSNVDSDGYTPYITILQWTLSSGP